MKQHVRLTWRATHMAVRLTAIGAALCACATPASEAAKDVLENYYGNTLVCAAGVTGEDACHIWFERNGRMIIFDPLGAHPGRYEVGPVRADGKAGVCLYYDRPTIPMVEELAPRMPGPPPGTSGPPGAAPPSGPPDAAGPPGAGGPPRMQRLECATKDFRTICKGVDIPPGQAMQNKPMHVEMAERFHRGMCYPLGPHEVGDVWIETDDPMPSQGGKDELLLLEGRR